MSTPGSGGPQPPEHDPGQPGQPASWGQQPPAGQPYPGQQPPAGQPYPGQQPPAGQPYPGQQPPAGQQPWGTPQPGGPQQFGQQPGGAQAFGQPEKPKRNWVAIGGGILGLLVVLALLFSFLGGGNSAEAGDCVNDKSDEIGVVDCDSDEAAFTVAGVVEDVSQNELADGEEVCEPWPNWVAYAWEGSNPDDLDAEGTGYCLEELAG